MVFKVPLSNILYVFPEALLIFCSKIEYIAARSERYLVKFWIHTLDLTV